MSSNELLERILQLLESSPSDDERQQIVNEILKNATTEQNHLKLAQVHLALGYHYFKHGRYKSAEQEFKLANKHACHISNEYLIGRALLGNAAALGEQGYLEEAITITEKARFYLQKSNQWDKIPVTHHNIGEFLLRLGKLNDAITSFEQAMQTARMVKRTDIIIDSMSMMSKARFLKGEHALALEDIKQAITFADQYQEMQERISTRVQLIDIILRMNADLNQAKGIVNELTSLVTEHDEQNVTHLQALMILCLYYLHSGNLTAAINWFHILESNVTPRIHELSPMTLLKMKRLHAKLILADYHSITSLEERRYKALEIYEQIIQGIKREGITDEEVPIFYLEYAELLLELNRIEDCMKYLQELEILASQRSQPRMFVQSILLQYLVSTLQGKKEDALYLRKRATDLAKHHKLDYIKPIIEHVFAQAEAIECSARLHEQGIEDGYSKEQVEFIQTYLQEVINEFSSL